MSEWYSPKEYDELRAENARLRVALEAMVEKCMMPLNGVRSRPACRYCGAWQKVVEHIGNCPVPDAEAALAEKGS